jgi:hypothetical protein
LQAFDYTSVVFDQDADHEDVANKRHVVGSTLFKRARGKVVVYHAKAGQKVGDPVPVKAFDEKDEAMQEAIRNGHASVIDTSDVQDGSQNLSGGGDVIGALENGYANGGAPPLRPKAASRQNSTGPSMHSSAQDLGAMQSPGSSNTGWVDAPSEILWDCKLTFHHADSPTYPGLGSSCPRNARLAASQYFLHDDFYDLFSQSYDFLSNLIHVT